MFNTEFVQIGSIIFAAFIIGIVATRTLLPILREKKLGQNIREEGPQSHLRKSGTPSMGGIAIIVTTVITGLAASAALDRIGSDLIAISVAFVVFGLLGFWDDFTKVAKKRNLGLRAWQKLAAQIAFSVAIAAYMAEYSLSGTSVYIPFMGAYIDFGHWYIPFVAFVIVAMTNSVNLTDGLDGLAAGVTAVNALFFAVAAAAYNFAGATYFCAAMCGACLGFLVFNKNPAKIFMGDTGSLALGGGLAVAAVQMNMTLLLPIAGLVYVLEALSVIIQVAAFKTTGKRVFKMAPLHHHFELKGMKEKNVVALFWVVSLICCTLALSAL